MTMRSDKDPAMTLMPNNRLPSNSLPSNRLQSVEPASPEPILSPHPADIAPLTHAEIRSIVLGIVLAMFLGALDQTIVATALPTIGRELGDFEHMSWVASIYLLTATAATPLYGKLSDIHGRRIVLLSAITIFLIGSVVCAVAPTMLALIAARALQGLGGGGLISLAQTIIADIVAPRERGRYQVYFAGVFMSASLLGPVLGGAFTELLHWSFIFWINIPLGIAAYWMTSSTLRRLPRHDRPHRLDVLGAVLMVGATVSLMLALSYGGLRYDWASREIVGLLILSTLFWALFSLRVRFAAEPLIPLDVLRNPVMRMGTISACFGMGTYIGLTIYMPVYFETVIGLGAAQSGLALIPLMAGTVIGATTSGRVMMHFTHYKRLPVAGLSVAVAATLILFVIAPSLSFWTLEAVLGLISLGLGTLLPTTTVAIQNAVQPYQLGTATGAMNFFRQLGGALIVAAFGAILLGNAQVGAGLPIESVLHGEAAVQAFRWVFFAACLGFAAALLFISLMEERPLRTGPERDVTGAAPGLNGR
jgi:EmrB/QacA subfamily drug resistance transporter